jgi:hypothetical protein
MKSKKKCSMHSASHTERLDYTLSSRPGSHLATCHAMLGRRPFTWMPLLILAWVHQPGVDATPPCAAFLPACRPILPLLATGATPVATINRLSTTTEGRHRVRCQCPAPTNSVPPRKLQTRALRPASSFTWPYESHNNMLAQRQYSMYIFIAFLKV